jgi:hypothetical protein
MSEELTTFGYGFFRQSRDVFQRIKRRLAWIAQSVLIFAALQGDANDAVNRSADLAHRLEFVVNDRGIGVIAERREMGGGSRRDAPPPRSGPD